MPFTVAPVFSVMDVRARIDPWKLVVVPSVAELPTCQKTLHGEAPLMSFTWLADAVMSVDAAWKTKTAAGIALRVERQRSGQVERAAAVDARACSVSPPRVLATTGVAGVCPAASLYAVTRSAFACTAAGLATFCTPPLEEAGGNPVTELPGLNPRFPPTVVGPVLVTVEPARIA